MNKHEQQQPEGRKKPAKTDELQDLSVTAVIAPLKHPSELPVDQLTVPQMQQYLAEHQVEYDGDPLDRAYLLDQIISGGLPAIQQINVTDIFLQS